MQYRTIPIRSAPQQHPAALPRLVGDTPRARRLLGVLEEAVRERVPGPVGCWLDEFRLAEGECTVALRRDLHGDALVVAQAAFDALRRLLPDTDIYIGAARH